MCWHFRQEFSSTTTAPSLARAAITSRLHAHPRLQDATELIDDIALIVSELATNSLQAGASSFSVATEIHGGEARVEVGDTSPAMPSLRHPDPNNARGRGLLLVAGLAAQWGVERRPIGKTVWAVLPVPEPTSSLLKCDRTLASRVARGSNDVARQQAEVGTGNDLPSSDLPEGGAGFLGGTPAPLQHR